MLADFLNNKQIFKARYMNDIKFDFSELFWEIFSMIVLDYKLYTTCCWQFHTAVTWLAPSPPLRAHNHPIHRLYKTVSTSSLNSSRAADYLK